MKDWKQCLMDLNTSGVIGKFRKGKLVIDYNGKEFIIEKDFSNFPKELNKFKTQIITVFGGRKLGGNSGNEYRGGSNRSPVKQGHIESRYIRGLIMREEAFLEDLKRDLKKEILSEGK